MNLLIAGADFTCFVFLLIMISTFPRFRRVQKYYKHYYICTAALAVFSLIDAVAFWMDEFSGNDLLHFYTNLFSYIGIDVVLIFFVYFLSDRIRQVCAFSVAHARVVLAACLLDILIVVVGAYTGLLFRVDNQVTVYGPLNEYLGLSQVFVSLYVMLQLFRHRKALGWRIVLSFSSFFVLPIVSSIIEALNSNLMLSYEASSMALLLVYISVVQEELQASTATEKHLYEASISDELTGLYNRHAYETDLLMRPAVPPEENFVYVSVDVNGLKQVNDTLGHAAGDELIRGTAACLKAIFGPYGKVYRVGGDEFTAIIFAGDEKCRALIQELETVTYQWRGALVDSLALSVGYAAKREFPDKTVKELEKVADERMYLDKEQYYSRKGVDRRGLNEAHRVLCSLYTKILKINLTTDAFAVINMEAEERDKARGFTDHISQWLEMFGRNGYVHPDDLDIYLRKTNPDFMRRYFRRDKTSLTIYYRRKHGERFKQAMMEIIPAGDYTDDNQSLFLYVKDFDL